MAGSSIYAKLAIALAGAVFILALVFLFIHRKPEIGLPLLLLFFIAFLAAMLLA